jgi:alkanesulfonate monooxygenase SsuD/methylene tetrahydromethanopterin reductase-like flavin-dependent oxidoreductase (luciferase family)
VIEAGAETADHLGWEAVWTTDHVLVPQSAATEYGRTFEAIATLAWVGARHARVRLGTSVIVVPPVVDGTSVTSRRVLVAPIPSC